MEALDTNSLRPAGMDDGEVVWRVFAGEPPFARFWCYEPSLLPHIARLCHDFSISEVLVATEVFGTSSLFPWPQLAESARDRLAIRFDDGEFELHAPGQITGVELAVRRARAARIAPPSDALWSEVDAVDDIELRTNLTARLLEIDPAPATHHLEWVEANLDERWGDIESIRALVAVVARLGRPVRLAGIEVAWGGSDLFDPFRAAHVLPELSDPDECSALAAAIVDALGPIDPPEWMLALLVSRVAPHLPAGFEWSFSDVFDPDGVWVPFLERLRTAGRANSLADDTRRAHPFATVLDSVDGPHETTGDAPQQMLDRHAGAGPPESAGPGESSGSDGDGSDGGEPEPDQSQQQQQQQQQQQTTPKNGESEVETAPPTTTPIAGPPHGVTIDTGQAEFETPGTRPVGESTSESTSAAADDRRLGVDVLVERRPLQRAVVADALHELVVSIGGRSTFALRTPIGVTFDAGTEVRSLPIRFVADGVDDTRTMHLGRDPSSSASVTFAFTPPAEGLNAMVIVYNEDRSAVLQAASLTADAVPTLDDETTATTSILFSPVQAAALATESRSAATIVTNGDVAVATTTDHALPGAVAAVVAQTTNVIELLQSASADLMLLADADTFRIALVGAARAGVRLRLDLGIDALAAVDRIQVVSLTPQSVLPLELVYDGTAPDADAVLCDRWRKALGSGRCRQCARRAPGDQAKFVCPVRFWGMTKIIEHHQGSTLAGADFSARVLPSDEMRSVTRPTSALIAVSAKVIEAFGATVGAAPDDAASPIGDLVTRAGAFGTAGVVDGWTTWVEAIERDGPSMLIALPHQGSEDVVGVRDVATLELGGTSLDLFEERHVRRSTDRPGPVMLLLGCNTGVEHRLIASFASKFRPWAPVIIATVGEIIADEAPEVASAIVDELARAWRRRRKTTIGEAVRNTRRALLADSRLVGLQLVMHGDASWGFETSLAAGTGAG